MLRHLLKLSATLGVFSLLLSGCMTPYQNPNLPNLRPSSEYYSLADDYTDNKKLYDGFNETMEYSATLLNTPVSMAQLDHKARIYQWSVDQYNTNKADLEKSLAKETKIFLSFYVPERKQDDLNKAKTLWKIFLDAGGRRYEGKAERIKTILAETQSLYPHHTRFQTPYVLIFPVPVTQIENTESKLTLTGPVGSSTVEFKAVH